jgi:glycosyltransferase involved in cell wall biosynthesis/O-antigen/teichoic acid export membrane protein
MIQAKGGRTRHGLLANSFALLAASHITAVLGYLFWIACARGFSASTIGMASTVISAMTLVAILAATGFEPFLTRVLPGANCEERGGLCGTALVITAVVSGVIGVAGALLLPGRVHAIVGTGWLIGLLGAGAVGTALLFVINAALLGVRRAELSLFGGVVGSLSRLVTVAALLGFGMVATIGDATAVHTILAVWVASLMISIGLSVRLLVRATPGFRFRCGWIWLTRLRRSVAWDHVAMLAGRLPALGLPILASALFPAAQVGYAAVALMVVMAFSAVSSSVSNALLANCADRPERLRAQTRRAVRLIGALLIAPVVITCLLASKVLGLFGADYADYSTLLVLLLMATLPEALVNVMIATLRVQRRLIAVAAVTVTAAVIIIGGSLLMWLVMPNLGITGAGWAVLASGVIVATTLAVMWRYQSMISARTADTVGDSPACVADEPPAVVAVAPPAGEAPSENRDRSGRSWHRLPTAELIASHPDDTDDSPRGLRILHATDTFRPNVGGLELAVAALVRGQVRRRQVVAVATPPHPDAPGREVLDGAQIHRLPMTMARVPGAYVNPTQLFFPPVPDPRFERAFADLIARFRPDVIHAHGWILYSVLGAARRAGVPVVATTHDHSQVCATKVMLYHGRHVCSGPGLSKCIGCAYHHYGLKGIPLAAGLHELGSRRHRDVAQWIAISSALAARGSAPRPADRSPMEVIPTYIDDDLLAIASDERTAARPSFVPATGAYLFYAGALGIYKGVDVLLDAHARLRAGGLDIPLVLAGLPRGDYQVGDRPGVVVVANVPHTAVVAAWRHAVVGVVPSLVPEGFGLVALECLAAGTPCVVSALGGLLDVVADGVEGLHVPPGDAEALASALRRLLEDEPLRSRLGAAGPAKAARFTLSQVLPRLDEVYLRVLVDAEADREVGEGKAISQPPLPAKVFDVE